MPSIWIPTTEIPYDTSGKLDRQKLRDLVATIASSQPTVSQYSLRTSECLELPTSRTEKILQELFGLSLNIKRSQIGRRDDFFALGGDSVGAMKLVTAARKQFGLILHVTDIFKHPTLGDLAAIIDDRNEANDNQLAPESAAPLDLVDVSSALPEAAAQCKASPVDVEDIYPTSALQEGMMALGLRSPGAYITQAVFALPSSLDVPRMQAAWDTVAQVHAILRTRIISLDAIGHMQVSVSLVTRPPPSWTVTDVENLEAYLARDKATVFGYGEPLLRLAVVRQTTNPTAYFVWTAHHATYDGWSMTALFKQVDDAFWGKPVMPTTPFKQFIGHIKSIDESAADDFWKVTLDGQRSFPVSFPPTSQDNASSFPGKLATKIAVHAQAPDAIAPGILDSTIKRAAWALTLASFSDCPDIIFAQTLSGRSVSMSGIEEVVGPTVATVPVRVRFPTKLSGVTVRSFLEKLQADAFDSMEFEQVGLQHIREVSIDARGAVDNISNLLVIQPKQHDGDVTFLGMKPLPRHEDIFLEYYPLTVLCNLEDSGEYTVEALFDENVISPDQTTRILHQFQHMVQQLSMISNMDTPLDAIELLKPYDLQDIRKWNTNLPMRVDACIPDLISENVSLRPDSEAVCAWNGQLSYREFDLVTLKLSSRLASLGVGREVKVGLCFDKSIWNLVSMYAVMRTGGVCVPLLPTYPRGRIAGILEDIGAFLVLVSPQHSSIFDGTVPNVLPVDQHLLDSLPSHMDRQLRASHHIKPRDAAFIVFTSGSTGRPKGVVIEHSGFCTMAHHQLGKLMLGPESRVLQFATHTFDICLFESFAPLVRGGCVCIPSEHQRMNNLVQAINELRVDWVIIVSTIAQNFYPEDVPSLKTLVLGGEPLRADIHARWAPHANLFNDYGPAECSILAVMTPSTSQTPPSMIGKGYGGRTWVVDKDDHDRLLPIGCVGELLIEGPILARGYLNNPQETAESYINDPLWASSLDASDLSSRFYKTGDLVRYVEDGNLIYLGRKDTQVKIRGLRVELGEIEHHVKISPLNTYKQAVEKVLLGDDVDKAALAAFVVPSAVDVSNANHTADRSEKFLPWSSDLECQLLELRQYLTKSLPAYMVPTLYIPLHDMPETQTNKIDRNALKRIGAAVKLEQIALYSLSSADRPAASSVKRAPSTKTEILLQGLWARLMNIELEHIDAHDNFFANGGDSIKAMRLTSLARSHGVSLTVADIFKNPELSQMALVATWLDDREQTWVNDPIKPFDLLSASHSNRDMAIKDAATQCSVSEDAIRDMYPCTPLQEGLMELATQRQGAYTAQRVYRLHGDIDIGRFQGAWAHLVALHPILRTRIVLSSTSGEAIQVVIDEHVTWQQEFALSDYLAADSSKPIYYGSPLARYALDAEHRHFIWTVHHALYDGYSSKMLMEQLEMLYRGSRIHPPVTHYNSFVRAVTSGVSVDEMQAFWTKLLAHGAPESFPHLPSATHQSCPDSEITMTINVEGHRRAGQPFMLSTLLRSAWAIVTAWYMGSQHVAFAATNSGRNTDLRGIDMIVGPTITTVPFQIAVVPDMKITDFLNGVQQLGIDMVPFEQAGVQRAFGMAGRKQNLRNLFVIHQSLIDESEKSSFIMDEVVDKALLRGFHVYPVVVECNVIKGEKVHVELQFDKSVLAEPTARFVLEQFEHVVSQLLTPTLLTSGASLADIGLVPSAHIERMISWNDAVDTQDIEECVHDIFRRQANVRPDAEAVVSSWEGSLTYGQLDELSDRLAGHLVEKGIRPESLVPMCFDKSIYTVVAMMATLKAGGACVHLGIKSPSSRLLEIIRQVDASVILADVSNSHNRGAASLLPCVSPTNPAFVLFTSGSTGKPKGVVVEHGSLCTSSRAHGTNRKIGPGTRLFQFAAYTFDVSVADIFTTLQRGGCICVPSEDDRINDLSGVINRLSCNYAFLTPTVAGLVEPSSVPGLRTLILGGELLTSDNIHRWAPQVDLIISYGMTECSIHCVDAVPLTIDSHPANLGRPSGCHMWIVDENDHNKLAPLGAVGELVIEGRMVSRGYLNDKIKTDAAFITNPAWASGKSGSKVPRRMYKTGDLCRYSPSGEICYVSRKDFQVKHYGQRIELGDIEHHTAADGRVHQAVVLLPKRGPLQKKLVAVLSLESSSKPLAPTRQLALVSSGLEKGIADLQVSAIRSYLATKVPDYMVPTIWIAVQALPLTPNNKLDRVTVLQWLEKMDEAGYHAIVGQGQDKEHGAAGSPATSQQKLLHDVLAQILRLRSIHMGRSFLDLGGDSIAAMQLRAKCRVAGLSLTVPDILSSRSMFDLASAAQLLHTGPTEPKDTIGVALPVTAWQQACLESAGLPQMMSAAKVTPAVRITVPNLLRAVEALVQQYSSLRTRFSRNTQGKWAQTITKGLSSTYYTFKAHSLSSLGELDLCLSNLNNIQLNVETEPLFSVHLFHQENSEGIDHTQVIVLRMHALVADAKSMSVLVDDLLSLLDRSTIPGTEEFSLASLLAETQEKIEHKFTGHSESALESCNTAAANHVSGGVIDRTITLDKASTSLLMGDSNRALSTLPQDIVVTAIALAWREILNRYPSSIVVRDDSRPSRAVGQFSRLRQNPEIDCTDCIQVLAQVKDSRVGERIEKSLMRRASGSVEVMIDTICPVPAAASGQDHAHELICDTMSWGPHPKLCVTPTLANDRMMLKLTYHDKTGDHGAFAHLIKTLEQYFPRLLAKLSSAKTTPTLSDFPLLKLGYAQLEKLGTILDVARVSFSDVEAIVPCTPLQQRMLESQKRTPGSYQSDTAHRITSGGTNSVDVARLQGAFAQVTARHEALRTIFLPSVARPGEYYQLVLNHYEPSVQVIHCEEADVSNGSIIQEHHTVHHASMKPHVGLTLFQTESSLLTKLEISHALQDGASMRIIYQDLICAYQYPEYFATPSISPSLGFRDYASWLETQHQNSLTESTHFWTQYLDAFMEKPCHIPRSQIDRAAGRGENVLLPIPIDTDPNMISQICRLYKVTPSTFFQGAWATCLQAVTGLDEVMFAQVVADRDIADFQEVVGPLINMLACRVRATGSDLGADVMRRVHESFLETLPFQHGFILSVGLYRGSPLKEGFG
ncbi:amino acid adenylation [Diaporthe eres]|nr:amino acid adenylation [Diaporthe eres]